MCNNKNYKKASGFLRAEPLSSYFEDRKGHREGKKLLSAKSVFPSLTATPIDDDAKKHNENLSGMGGVFNTVNLHLYHYAGNNPVKYVDPDGRDIEEVALVDPGLGLMISGRGSIGIAKDSTGRVALFFKGEIGIVAGGDIKLSGDAFKKLMSVLGNIDNVLTASDLIGFSTPEDTGKGNFDEGIFTLRLETVKDWTNDKGMHVLPADGCFIGGVSMDKNGKLSPSVGFNAAAYFASGTLYIDITPVLDKGKTLWANVKGYFNGLKEGWKDLTNLYYLIRRHYEND